MTATVFMLSPLGGKDLSDWCTSYPKKKGRKPVKVPTTDLPKKKGDPATVMEDGVTLHDMVQNFLKNNNDDLVLFAHSRGCTVVGEWLAIWSNEISDDDAKRISIILTGNLERKHFGFIAKKPSWMDSGSSTRTTPENTRFKILDIGRKGDLWANYPGGVLAWPLLFVCLPHLNYFNIDPENLKPISEKVVGNTRYVNVK